MISCWWTGRNVDVDVVNVVTRPVVSTASGPAGLCTPVTAHVDNGPNWVPLSITL